jgi:hypothetical protein
MTGQAVEAGRAGDAGDLSDAMVAAIGREEDNGRVSTDDNKATKHVASPFNDLIRLRLRLAGVLGNLSPKQVRCDILENGLYVIIIPSNRLKLIY